MHARRVRSESGFTIIEVMVAAGLLLVGMLGTVVLVERAQQATTTTKFREAGTNLAREVVEQSRAVPFTQLTQAGVLARLTALPGLEPKPGGGWNVDRRGTTFGIAVAVCAVDDPRDGAGDHAGGTFCAGSAPGTADPAPQDFKKVTATVTWSDRGVARSTSQSTLIATNGAADAPAITDLRLVSPVVTDPTRPRITSAVVTTATFEATATSTATRVRWSVEGAEGTADATPVGGSKYRFSLDLSSSRFAGDGDYDIGAKAIDTTGAVGPVFEIPLFLQRGIPKAPTEPRGGANEVRIAGTPTEVVEIEWIKSESRTVTGYRVYRGNGTVACNVPSSASACIDTAPVFGTTYRVVSLYLNDSNAVAEGGSTANVGPFLPLGPSTLWLSNTAAGTAPVAGCPTGTGVSPPGSLATSTPANPSATWVGTFTFCSAGSERWNFAAGAFQFRLWMRNGATGAAKDCTVTAALSTVNAANVSTPWGSSSFTVGNNTNWAERVFPAMNLAARIVPAGTRMHVRLSHNGDMGCPETAIDAGVSGSVNRPSRLTTTGGGVGPNPPTNLVKSTGAGGITITWDAATGGTIFAYRIYKNGQNVANRDHRTGDANERTYTDPSAVAGDTYWVTALNTNLTESSFAGPVVR